MPKWLTRIVGDKQRWHRMQARAAALPRDYRVLYGEIKKYMFKFSSGDGLETVAILEDLLGLFETAAADGRRAIDVTGENVAAFCDELLGSARTYTDKWRQDLNRAVRDQLHDAGPGQ